MNYNTLVFTLFMANSFLSYTGETPKRNAFSRTNPLFAWALGGLALKTAYHGLRYVNGAITLESINQGHLSLGSLGSRQAAASWHSEDEQESRNQSATVRQQDSYAADFINNTHEQNKNKLEKTTHHHKRMFKFSAFLTFTGGLAYIFPRINKNFCSPSST